MTHHYTTTNFLTRDQRAALFHASAARKDDRIKARPHEQGPHAGEAIQSLRLHVTVLGNIYFFAPDSILHCLRSLGRLPAHHDFFNNAGSFRNNRLLRSLANFHPVPRMRPLPEHPPQRLACAVPP